MTVYDSIADVVNLASNIKCICPVELIQYSTALPPFTSPSDWVALKLVDMVKEVSILCIVSRSFCTRASCPRMCAGFHFDYNWVCDEGYAERVSAPSYMERLLDWAHTLIQDPSKFPKSLDVGYPPEAMAQFKTLYKRIFRVYAHVYLEHYASFEDENALRSLNTSFLHLFLFGREFELLSTQDVSPVMCIVDALMS